MTTFMVVYPSGVGRNEKYHIPEWVMVHILDSRRPRSGVVRIFPMGGHWQSRAQELNYNLARRCSESDIHASCTSLQLL